MLECSEWCRRCM